MCPSCGSNNQSEFLSEIDYTFRTAKASVQTGRVGEPEAVNLLGLWLFVVYRSASGASAGGIEQSELGPTVAP